jgi:hypothetical protein
MTNLFRRADAFVEMERVTIAVSLLRSSHGNTKYKPKYLSRDLTCSVETNKK